MKPGKPLERRTPLKADPATTQAFVQRGRESNTSMRKRRPISPASDVQRAFIKGKFCIVCGADELIDPAHIIDRSLLSDRQDDLRAVVPLCRWGCHTDYDEHRLDLLPYLEQDGWREHLAFAVARFGFIPTLERVSNTRWAPVESRTA